jgi:heat shock protein HslJ
MRLEAPGYPAGMRRAWMLLAVAVVAVVACAGAASAQPDALTGKTWVLTSLRGKPPMPGTTLTSTFTPGGDVSGSAGCNHYGGRFAISGGTIEISSLVSTLMGCPQKIAAQEAAFLKALGSAHTYRIGGGKLILSRADGRALLTYRARHPG